MKIRIKTLLTIVILLFTLIFTACSFSKEPSTEVKDLPQYSQVTVLENKEDNSDIYRIENKSLYKIGTTENLIHFLYCLQNKIFVSIENIQKGNNFYHNKIVVIKDKKKKELKDFYSALDAKISPNGYKIAFRSFKDDSRDSAEGMRVYDIEKGKYINLNSKVLVSGDLYEWISNDKIIYYGSISGEKDSDKIYSYDFTNNREEVYLDNTNGYCLSFVPIGKNLLFISRRIDSELVYYFDAEKNTTKSIPANIVKIRKYVANSKDGEVFFIGKEVEDSAQGALYKFSVKDSKIVRLTYDFPKSVYDASGLGIDDKGNVYFCGTDELKQYETLDVYMYDRDESSINLISNHKGKYSVYSSK